MLKASIIVTGLATLGSLVSFASQLAIAAAFGTSGAVDAYLIASSLPMTFAGLAAALISFSLLPRLIRLSVIPDAAGLFAGRLSLHLAWFVPVFAGFGICFAPSLTLAMAPMMAADVQPLLPLLARLSWLTAAFLLLSAFLGVVLTANKRIYLPVLLTTLPYISTLASIGLFSNETGVAAVAWGMMAGAAAAAAISLVAARGHFRWSADRAPNAEIRDFLSTLPLAAAALSCFVSYAVSDAFWAPSAAEGALAILGYGQRLVIAAGSFVVIGPSVLLASAMAAAALSRGTDGAEDRIHVALKASLSVAVCVALSLGPLASPLIAIAFERGSFDSRSTAQLAGILPLLLAGMIPMIGSVILLRGLFQLQREKLAAFLGLSWTALYAAASGAMVQQWGAKGIAVAYAASWWTIFGIGLALLIGSRRRTLLTGWLAFAAVSLLAACLTALVAKSLGLQNIADAAPWSGRAALLLGEAAIITLTYGVLYVSFSSLKPFASARFWLTTPGQK